MSNETPNYTLTPDFKYWCTLSGWTFDEALALSLGLDPRAVESETTKRDDFPPELTQEFEKRRVQFARACACNQFPYIVNAGPPVIFSARDFIEWAISNRVELPTALVEEIRANNIVITNWKVEHDKVIEKLQNENEALKLQIDKFNHTKPSSAATDPLRSDERLSLLKMIRGIAVEKYAYDPDKKRNSAARDITSDVEKQGFKIDDGTVRKWLDQAFDLVRGEE